MVDTPFTSFPFAATGASQARAMPDRLADVFNVKDFGALGNGVHDDSAAIRASLLAMWSSTDRSGTLFFPPGRYIVSDDGSGSAIDIGKPDLVGINNTDGRIIGSGRHATFIHGTLNNGWIFYQNDGVNGPEEISHMTIGNDSTWIGSGGMMVSNTSMACHNVSFGGSIGCLLPYNIYEACFYNCTAGAQSDVTTGYLATLGIAGFAPHIHGWRSTIPLQAAFQFYGSNGCHFDGNSIENCVIACSLGTRTGWGSHCTISGDILTVSGMTGSGPGGGPDFTVSRTLFGRGLDMPAWGSDPNDTTGGVTIIDDHNSDPTLTGEGWTGTYRISSSFTISTPIPIWTRIADTMAGCNVTKLTTEGCQYIVYINKVSLCNINIAGGGNAGPECPNQFGIPGYVQKAGIYIKEAGATSIISSGTAASETAFGGIVFAPNALTKGITFDACYANKGADNVVVASIKNAAGTGAGDILNITTFTSGSHVGIGMVVTGAGVTPGTRIIASSTNDPTLTGYQFSGTWRVDTVQNVSSEAMTVVTGADWVPPTDQASLTGITFSNYTSNTNLGSGLNNFNMHFSALPGQADWLGYIPLFEGQEFFIKDGAKAGGGAAAVGDATQGGGTQHIKVGWNGTSWVRSW